MQFAIAALGLAAVVSASYAPSYGPPKNATTTHGPSYTTEVVTSYETFCPSATSIEHNGVTYTVTEATTLTITNCPCTVTKPVYTSVVTACSTCAPPPAETPKTPETPNSPVQPPAQPPAPHYPSNNATAPAPPAYQPPAGTAPGAYVPPATTSPIAPAYTGAGSKASFGVAGVMAAAGLIAAL
ncbi:hypothetical protein CKM354_001174900 [Cercospora kikuchii]|uniref:Clock-controlled protein 6 n=1 Tax=Cercospora kikuchii TaxID=84275 RepID=A0A9P3CQ33_9PEZI|nr:uncharacterized protein CKM354_001174900 [Cercospora kikuchii]GIZ48699.1 hypothetical protein CKM354_001174900 [Cercospora kikuchii]